MKNQITHWWPLLLLLALQGLFLIWPSLDLLLSGLFYTPREGFFLAEGLFARLSDALFGNLHIVAFVILPWLLLASVYWMGDAEAALRRRLLYLFLVFVLAPGVAVGILQAESGRAPPQAVTDFGGEDHFTGAFRTSAECRSDCSFVSRHAVVGFTFIAFAWVFADRRWLGIGVLLGGLAGLGQVIQGTHYPSDVLFGFWIVYGTCLLLAHLVLGDHRIPDRRFA